MRSVSTRNPRQRASFSEAVPPRQLRDRLFALEVFHGPAFAFQDRMNLTLKRPETLTQIEGRPMQIKSLPVDFGALEKNGSTRCACILSS